MTQTVKRPALGQGLSALLGPDFSEEKSKHVFKNSENFSENSESFLPLNKIQGGKYQPRRIFDDQEIELLAQSIKENGIIQPIIVRLIGPDRYEILAGERRWRAAERAGLESVPVIIRNQITDQQALEISLLENIQRQDLNPIEEAEGYQRLIREFGYTQEAIAQTLGKSRPHVANTLRLLNLPHQVCEALIQKRISAGHSRVLLSVGDGEIEDLLRVIISKNLNVRQTERLVKNSQNQKFHDITTQKGYSSQQFGVLKPEALSDLESVIQKVLQTPCEIFQKEEKLQLVLTFPGFEKLDEFLNRITQ